MGTPSLGPRHQTRQLVDIRQPTARAIATMSDSLALAKQLPGGGLCRGEERAPQSWLDWSSVLALQPTSCVTLGNFTTILCLRFSVCEEGRSSPGLSRCW